MVTYFIKAKYKNREAEIIDEFDNEEEAIKMLTEYRIAYSNDFVIWWEQELSTNTNGY